MSNRKHRDNQEICARKVRELAQSGVNKHCFECGQPGVTYIDITVGCFVCTSCSGILRGLNPPHRVKSISMTTFTQQEVEFLQNHGNEVGKRTWLCAYDPKTDGCFDTRDAQRLKEFLQDKYEKKKWHFSKNKNWREAEGPFSPGGQGLSPPHPRAPGQLSSGPPTRTLSQSHLASWDKAPGPSPADLRTDVFTARPSRSQSLRDPSVKDTILCGIGRQRPSTILPGMAPQSHGPPFPALPRPSGKPGESNQKTCKSIIYIMVFLLTIALLFFSLSLNLSLSLSTLSLYAPQSFTPPPPASSTFKNSFTLGKMHGSPRTQNTGDCAFHATHATRCQVSHHITSPWQTH
uniref:ArfGAP with FG repeats 2 n=1 Tax=Paramormyrops kingsleyae TaxID=1676925 RepID=A0A3B3S0P4_9TELE